MNITARQFEADGVGRETEVPLDTWFRLLIWLAIGLLIYFGYGKSHSRVGRGEIGTVRPR